ncbi:MAG: hypothetical protein K8W52_09275 [Deltaproteobacteria bacterium]|nr:hypothetical protein [Deltaproteobacteria bacterium]
MRAPPLVSLAALAVAACDPTVHDLDDASSDELHVEVRRDSDWNDDLQVVVTVDLPTAGRCLELGPSFGGALEGLAPTRIDHGLADYEFGCAPATLTFDVPAARRVPDATLTVGDASRTIAIPLGDRLVRRTGALVTPADAIVRPGAPIAFTWSSAADRTSGAFHVFLRSPSQVLTDLDPRVRGDQIAVDAPARLEPGDGEACLAWEPHGLTLPCPGATCTLNTWLETCQPVRYAP